MIVSKDWTMAYLSPPKSLNKLWIYTQPLIYFGMLLNFLKPRFARMKSLRSEYLDSTALLWPRCTLWCTLQPNSSSIYCLYTGSIFTPWSIWMKSKRVIKFILERWEVCTTEKCMSLNLDSMLSKSVSTVISLKLRFVRNIQSLQVYSSNGWRSTKNQDTMIKTTVRTFDKLVSPSD